MTATGEPPAPRRISFSLPLITPTLNQTSREHWATRSSAKRALAWEIKLACERQPVPAVPFARARVRIERHSVGLPDYDGMVGGMKGLIDCLLPRSKRHPCGLGFIADDNPRAMTLEAIAVQVAKRAEQKTVVIIEEIPKCHQPEDKRATSNAGPLKGAGRRS